MEATTRIGVMGCGQVASYGHLPAIARTPGLVLASVFDPDPSRLAQTTSTYASTRAFGDAEAFMRSGIDAVVITSPAPFHRANCELAARHGKPVLCEKPLAMDEADSAAMVAIMRAAGLPLYVGFTYRFAGPALEIKRLLSAGAIGRVRSLRLAYIWDCHGKFAPREPIGPGAKLNERRAGRMLEGGPMVDCGVHQIDLARWWLGSEVRRHVGVGAWVDDYDAPDHMYLHLDHADGAHTMVEISYSYGHVLPAGHPHFVYELIGDQGMIRYDREDESFELLQPGGTTTLPWDHEKNFDGMYQEFARALRTGQSGNLPTGDDGIAATRIAREATEAAIRNRLG